jgi:hypothetical protein
VSRSARAVVITLAVAMTAVGMGILAVGATAQTDAEFGTYSLVATAHGFEATEDEPSANAHPEGHGAAAQTSSLLANGGVGYGLAAMAWPGATAANGGALLGLLFPSQVGGQPTPDALSGAVKEAAPAANYPIKAEARIGSAPDASYDAAPGIVMTAHADAARVAAEASFQRAASPGMATYGNTRSASESTLTGTLGRAVATSSVNDVDLGGVVKIKSVTSTATAQTDGLNATGAGGTVVQGMTIAEQPAYVDDTGLHIGEQGQPANAVASQIANQALTEAGFTFYVSQPVVEKDKGSATSNAGSFVVVWKPPNNPSENVFVITFGGARVSVTAGEGFGSGLELATDAEDLPGADLGGDVSPSVPVDGGELAVSPLPGTAGPAPAAGPQTRPLRFGLASTFGGFSWLWLVFGLALVALAGAGNRRMLGDLLDRPAADCPLERDQ